MKALASIKEMDRILRVGEDTSRAPLSSGCGISDGVVGKLKKRLV